MSNMYLQNIRKVGSAILMASARQGIFFIPALYIGHLLLGFLGVEIAQTISDLCAFILAIPLTFKAIRGMGK